ncbi:MAG: cell division protein FtsZ, partial [Flavobacteriaceae bacterium]|nr:cell division protein FtsZ [Flavobacteriaceae bacterium]
ILTVGIVTIPFQFEGKIRNDQAHIGVEKLRQSVDSLVVINNNKLREVYGNLGFKAGFSKADEVLATAARGIAEVITHHYTQNIDLRDAKTVLANSGTAIMGSATATGANRAHEAIGKALDSPLLNDNKITGAKNVLLLIVSGTEEITIDEIGEISDHIQIEAGHSANIIMGVGEDESLEGSVSITVIATGFDAEQQHEITNTESKKIIHTLEEEQRAEQNLSPKPGATPVELPKETVETKPEPEPVIRHTLFEDEEIESIAPVKQKPVENKAERTLPFEGYIETSELIKQIQVDASVIDIHHIAEFEQLVINEIGVKDFEIVPPSIPSKPNTPTITDDSTETSQASEFVIKQVQQEQPKEEPEVQDQMLMFDMPLSSESETDESSNDDLETPLSVSDMEVKDSIQVIPVDEVSKEGIRRYSLDDYQKVEENLTKAKPVVKKEVAEEMKFETKTVPAPEEDEKNSSEEVDPMNTPISKMLRDRTEERKRKMKDFNYKFRNSGSKIDDIERQPAYKRMGIELKDTDTNPNLSRTSVNLDDDEIDLRNNNSFLHDNVD